MAVYVVENITLRTLLLTANRFSRRAKRIVRRSHSGGIFGAIATVRFKGGFSFECISF